MPVKMRASPAILGATLLALSNFATAVPAGGSIERRDGDNDNNLPNAPWVEIDSLGQPSTTYTPTVTSVGGTTSPVHTAPHDLTASLYTLTNYGHVSTSTGLPPNPTVTNTHTNQGSFSRCVNPHGEFAPFCRPSHNSSVYVDSTYYVTWDPDFYNSSQPIMNNQTNQTTDSYQISLRLEYLNETSGEMLFLDDFTKTVPAAWGYYVLPITKNYLSGHRSNNITVTLLGHVGQSQAANKSVALPLLVEYWPYDKNLPTTAPKGKTLTIALPVVFGTIAFLVIGICLWNRKTRRIQLGNIMSRSRHGYSGRRHRNLFRKQADTDTSFAPDTGVELDRAGAPISDYRDTPDSDPIGNLSGSPVRGTFEEQGTTGGNTFRDEVARQDRERRGQRF